MLLPGCLAASEEVFRLRNNQDASRDVDLLNVSSGLNFCTSNLDETCCMEEGSVAGQDRDAAQYSGRENVPKDGKRLRWNDTSGSEVFH